MEMGWEIDSIPYGTAQYLYGRVEFMDLGSR